MVRPSMNKDEHIGLWASNYFIDMLYKTLIKVITLLASDKTVIHPRLLIRLCLCCC